MRLAEHGVVRAESAGTAVLYTDRGRPPFGSTARGFRAQRLRSASIDASFACVLAYAGQPARFSSW